ncbi:ribulose-phosphate 3-epimerase [Mahella australiensis]|uniref:Ribulose-phosphate 3-epimerase n=1 Tax=Mahella australiensis (strain DSM 15567 / CIP 107919 / 50-1 BON) TaxID=697281 RepID=F4A2E2_MAHA5|nr:ribulose-phosphate 3-epimerase [Mahella australiensis]AEE96189.1 ribulose-5-phosphate 3-epimerase [Mahella australiensis 50-1 BON]
MVKLIPSILSADFFDLGHAINELQKGGADGIHVDVMDGHFVPNISMGPMMVKSIKSHINMFMDVHLMIDNPDEYIDAFSKAGADSITVHAEVLRHPLRTIDIIKRNGLKAAIALNPATPLSVLDYIMDAADMILLMTVNPGFGGQQFIPSMLDKIADLKRIKDNRGFNFDIQIDGGITMDNVHAVMAAGANVIVTGSAILNQPDIAEAAADFKYNMLRGAMA